MKATLASLLQDDFSGSTDPALVDNAWRGAEVCGGRERGGGGEGRSLDMPPEFSAYFSSSAGIPLFHPCPKRTAQWII